jgi:ADP-ribose pyrophosphatase YjhB (NUDIX family)
MPISPYVRELRDRVGTTRLLLPSVSAHIFDPAGRLLLVKQREGRVWSTPGGVIEPDELPADAIVRETWEETGLIVSPQRLLAVYGGPEFVVQYPNGDEVQYVIAAFGCQVTGGALHDRSKETDAAGYWSEADAAALPLASWLRSILHSVYRGEPAFAEPRWTPSEEER